MTNNSTELRRRKAEELQGRQERRLFDGGFELRDDGNSGRLQLVGWPCLTDVSYEIGSVERGGFIETVRANSFSRTLSNNPDVILVAQHGDALSGLPIARTRSGTLRLEERTVADVRGRKGLHAIADLDPEDPDVATLRRKFARGDLDGQMSFAFRVPAGGDSWSEDYTRRTITQAEIHGGDISVVNFGASPTTTSEMVSRYLQEEVRRPLRMPSATQRAREQLVMLQAGRFPWASRSALHAVPSEALIDPMNKYKRRLAELRRG